MYSRPARAASHAPAERIETVREGTASVSASMHAHSRCLHAVHHAGACNCACACMPDACRTGLAAAGRVRALSGASDHRLIDKALRVLPSVWRGVESVPDVDVLECVNLSEGVEAQDIAVGAVGVQDVDLDLGSRM